MKRLILLGLLAALTCAPAAAQVFKCRNAAGKIVYSDSRCAPGTAGRETGITPNSAASVRPAYNPPMPQQEQTAAARPPEPPASQPPPEQGPPARQPSAFELEFQAELDKIAAKHAQRDSPACKSAIAKANVFDAKTTPEDTDRDRTAARQTCGYDPWPVSTTTGDETPPDPEPPKTSASDSTTAARCNAGRC
jgi:hypothetical protein